MLKIGKHVFRSRLLMECGKFSSPEIQQAVVEASGAEVLTFAVRRSNISDPDQTNFLECLDLSKYTLLPTTAGAATVEEALCIARLARASSKLCDMIKVEIIGDPKTRLPDSVATLEATRILVEEGFTVLPYINDDPILARRLEEAGAHAIITVGATIGSGLGLLNPHPLSLIIEQVDVPVIVDTGIGSPAKVVQAMEMGADGVLLSAAVFQAKDPVIMARALKLAVEAGRLGFKAGKIPPKALCFSFKPPGGYGSFLTDT